MVYNWGHVNPEDNKKLDDEFKLLKTKLSKTKKSSQAKKYVHAFLKKYLEIGEDPTDTVIRDKVWDRLHKLTKNIMTNEELNTLWDNTFAAQHSTSCTIQ